MKKSALEHVRAILPSDSTFPYSGVLSEEEARSSIHAEGFFTIHVLSSPTTVCELPHHVVSMLLSTFFPSYFLMVAKITGF